MQGDAGIRIPSAEWLQAIDPMQGLWALFILDDPMWHGPHRNDMGFRAIWSVPRAVHGQGAGGGMPIGGVTCSKTLLGQFAHAPSLGHITTFMATSGLCRRRGCVRRLGPGRPVGLEQRMAHWEMPGRSRRGSMRSTPKIIAVELENANAVKGRACGSEARQGPRRSPVLVFECA